jgi:hypothetical protein
MMLYTDAFLNRRDLTSRAGLKQRLQLRQQVYLSLLDAKSASTLQQLTVISTGWNSLKLITLERHMKVILTLKCSHLSFNS